MIKQSIKDWDSPPFSFSRQIVLKCLTTEPTASSAEAYQARKSMLNDSMGATAKVLDMKLQYQLLSEKPIPKQRWLLMVHAREKKMFVLVPTPTNWS